MIKIFLKSKNKKNEFEVKENTTLLQIAHENNIEIEGSCDGSMACSTCHIIIDSQWFKELKPACVEEKEMLTLIPNYQKYSRLGCQINITKKLNGLQFKLPEEH